MKKDRSSILAFYYSITIDTMFISVKCISTKLYTGGEKYEKDKVVALLLHLNGKMIEWVYKENLAQCLKNLKGLQIEK